MADQLVVAAPGRKVRDPVNMRPIQGAVTVNDANPYWARRLVAGDVVITTPSKQAAALAEAAKVAADQQRLAADRATLATDEAKE